VKRLLDADGGVVSTFHYDEDGETTTVSVGQDVEPILEANKAAQTINDGYNEDRTLKRIASIPLVVVQQWMKEDGVNFLALPKHEKQKYLRRKLNDPDNRFLRTSPGIF